MLRFLIDDLQIHPTRIVQEPAIRNMMRNRCGPISRLYVQIPTRQRHKLQRVLRQQIPHLLRTSKFVNAVRPQLNAFISDG